MNEKYCQTYNGYEAFLLLNCSQAVFSLSQGFDPKTLNLCDLKLNLNPSLQIKKNGPVLNVHYN